MRNLSAIWWREWVTFRRDESGDYIHFLLDDILSWKVILLPFWNNSPRVQMHVAPLVHIILTPGHPVFVRAPLCCLLNREEVNTNCIVFGITRPGPELRVSEGTFIEYAQSKQIGKPNQLKSMGERTPRDLHTITKICWCCPCLMEDNLSFDYNDIVEGL
jgi:hypothetical protein